MNWHEVQSKIYIYSFVDLLAKGNRITNDKISVILRNKAYYIYN